MVQCWLSMDLRYYFFSSLLVVFLGYAKLVKVCKNFESYYVRNCSDCYDNPDNTLNVTEIFRQRWNCTAEEYNLTTADGYQILVIRAYKEIVHSNPVIVGHGIMMNSLGFLPLYNKSLVYHIIHSGRQVFMINYRGSRYSTGHTGNISQNDYQYWKFSFHEMAKYDIPKILELVKSVTGEKAIFVAFSMSSTAGLAYASLNPEDAADNLKGIITMATAVFFDHSTSLFKKMASHLSGMKFFIKLLWNGKVFPRERTLPLIKITSSGPKEYLSIYTLVSTIIGYDIDGISSEHFPVVVYNLPDCLCENVAYHFSQIMNSGKFCQFDHGTEGNINKYGTAEPPEYDLFKIRVPVAQILGSGDLLATVKDAKRVSSLLNPKFNCGVTVLRYSTWTHLDFITSRYQEEFLIPVVLKKIAEFEDDSC